MIILSIQELVHRYREKNMDWFIQLTLSIVAGLFTFAYLFKRKNNEKEKKNEMTVLEQRAQQIIKQHLAIDAPSYEDVKKYKYTGYMEAYLGHSQNNQTMSTTADYIAMLELASIDKFRNHNIILYNL